AGLVLDDRAPYTDSQLPSLVLDAKALAVRCSKLDFLARTQLARNLDEHVRAAIRGEKRLVDLLRGQIEPPDFDFPDTRRGQLGAEVGNRRHGGRVDPNLAGLLRPERRRREGKSHDSDERKQCLHGGFPSRSSLSALAWPLLPGRSSRLSEEGLDESH